MLYCNVVATYGQTSRWNFKLDFGIKTREQIKNCETKEIPIPADIPVDI